jgi:hypothetical protein
MESFLAAQESTSSLDETSPLSNVDNLTRQKLRDLLHDFQRYVAVRRVWTAVDALPDNDREKIIEAVSRAAEDRGMYSNDLSSIDV